MSTGLASMTISSFVEVATKLPVTTSILLRGNHGIGKSQIVRQVAELRAKEDGIDRPVVDRRLAQMTEGDMLGLPSVDDGSTRFNPPDWFKECCDSPRVLLLDELNRANTEIMQAAFQIVLDRELSGMKLHKDTLVYAAVNLSAAYTVNEMDPALLDRFFVVDLSPSHEDWVAWARKENKKTGRQNIIPVMIDFHTSNTRWLDPPVETDPQAVSPSRRSWEAVSNDLVNAGIADEYGDIDLANIGKVFYNMLLGRLGTEAARTFRDFVKNYDRKVTAEEIFNSYTTKKVQRKILGPIAKEIEDVEHAVWLELVEKVSDYANKKLNKLTEKQGNNLKEFMSHLPDEVRLDCWSRLVQNSNTNIELTKSVHKYCSELILKVFNVKAGEAGIGMTPKIPGIFQDKK